MILLGSKPGAGVLDSLDSRLQPQDGKGTSGHDRIKSLSIGHLQPFFAARPFRILILPVVSRRVWGCGRLPPWVVAYVESGQDLSQIRRVSAVDYSPARLPRLYRGAGQQELLRHHQRVAQDGERRLLQTPASRRERAAG